MQNGTRDVGDMVVAGKALGRIRAMVSSRGERVKHATPSTPVEIIGFGGVPEAGDEFMAVADEKLARQVVEERAAEFQVQLATDLVAALADALRLQLDVLVVVETFAHGRHSFDDRGPTTGATRWQRPDNRFSIAQGPSPSPRNHHVSRFCTDTAERPRPGTYKERRHGAGATNQRFTRKDVVSTCPTHT